MGILQAAYRTYETYAHRAGVIIEGEKEPLAPLSHVITNAKIEITLSQEGIFQSAVEVPKEESKTLIPATIESAGRVGTNVTAHPLCDQLQYLAPYGGDKFENYLAQLRQWAASPFSHPIVQAILQYAQKGTIVQDLAASGLITLKKTDAPAKGGVPEEAYDKYLVRWRVIPGRQSACWQNIELFDCFIRFYAAALAQGPRGFCSISGQEDTICKMHPKGAAPSSPNAKLISANDSANFTYRGRFTQADQALSVGYIASQKAHSALRWVAANQGVVWGKRTFLCWNPEGKPVPFFDALGFPAEAKRDFVSYQNQLQQTLQGYRNLLKPEDDVIIAVLDAATSGRLSVTYYNELKSSDFLQRIERWYTTCCWDYRPRGTHSRNTHSYGIQSPTIYRIVSCAYGIQHGEKLETDPKLMREQAQQVLSCLVECRPIPEALCRALVVRAGMPSAYTPENWEAILATTCALIRKKRNDFAKAARENSNITQSINSKEEWTLSLDTFNRDRSYLFGRWLAVMEQVERSTYDNEEKREPNAIRMQPVFTRRPLYAMRILSDQLIPYFERLTPGRRVYFRRIIEEIANLLSMEDPNLEQPLEDTYLLGYYHQRSALTQKKKEENETEEEQNERTKK